jgi:beta-catenin-like protein 1
LIHFYKRPVFQPIKMDVREVTRFKPDTMLKPVMVQEEVEDEDSFESQAARRKLARKRAQDIAYRAEVERVHEEERRAKYPRTENDKLSAENHEQIDKMMEKGEDSLDDTGVKKIILAFEKKALKNQETRIKFPENPEKFMESEMELHDALQEMKNLATVPEYYPILVDLNCVPSMLGLLTHDNTDIAVGVLDLIQELTDVDTMNESEEGAETLIQSLVDNQVFALMIASFDRLDESVKEEADGVHNAMSILENIVELRPSVAKDAAEAGFMNWLIKRLKEKVPFDANKLYASEILSILLQNEPSNRYRT